MLCVALAMPLDAQATRLIDPLDPAYQDLELLVDLGLVDHGALGQRPLSRAEFARIIDSASHSLSLSGGAPTFAEQLLTSLRRRLDLADTGSARGRLAPRFVPLHSVTLDLTKTDQLTRLIPRQNGIGQIDARLNTLLSNRQGRFLSTGSNALLESSHGLETKYVALWLTPQASWRLPNDSSGRADLRLQELQLRFLFRNAALDVGREYLMSSQGRDVGLLNSNNSPPLDLIKLSSESPFYFPWVFRQLGPTRASVYYADLGGDQNFPHPYAFSYHATIAPTARLELGATVYTKSGGHGAPRATATARLIDLLPFLDASKYNYVLGTRGDFQFSDHYAGIDGRLRVPSIGANLFWEVLLNDFDVRRLTSVLWEDAGHVVGVELPRLSESGRLRTSLEYHHTGIRFYEHHQFLSGQTIHHALMGDPLGPDAQGAYANVDWYVSARRRLGVQVALERRSNDQYALRPGPNFGFDRIAVRPKEWQARAVTTWRLLPDARQLGGTLQLGYERTRNFEFVERAGRNGFLGRVTMHYRFQ